VKPYRSNLKLTSQKLRNEMTAAERVLWSRLRRKQLAGMPFYRQKPLLGYVVDFYCAKVSLVVELDGQQHFEKEQRLYDEQRSQELQSLGIRVMRFSNRQVMEELEQVVEQIYRMLL